MRTLKRLLTLVTLPALALADCEVAVDPYRELMIVDPLVVEDQRADAGGPWHFSSLLKQMLPAEATDDELADFTERWLGDSKATTQLNGFPFRFPGFALGERTICRWLDDETWGPCALGRVQPRRIPFKLIAIVNRLDLHGKVADVAEGRFVFGALTRPTDKPTTDPSALPFPETVIFEYALPMKSPADAKLWAERWHKLGNLACTTRENCEPFRRELESITGAFSTRGQLSGKPNGNPLAQIRTSHLAFGSFNVWNFRQFELQGEGKNVNLVSAPTSQTPHHGFDGEVKLAEQLNANEEKVTGETFVWPKSWLGGESLIDESKTHPWLVGGVAETLRRNFSVQTCSGCHSERDVTDGFFHVSPTSTGNAGKERLSLYLTGEELPKREAFMKKLLCP